MCEWLLFIHFFITKSTSDSYPWILYDISEGEDINFSFLWVCVCVTFLWHFEKRFYFFEFVKICKFFIVFFPFFLHINRCWGGFYATIFIVFRRLWILFFVIFKKHFSRKFVKRHKISQYFSLFFLFMAKRKTQNIFLLVERIIFHRNTWLPLSRYRYNRHHRVCVCVCKNSPGNRFWIFYNFSYCTFFFHISLTYRNWAKNYSRDVKKFPIAEFFFFVVLIKSKVFFGEKEKSSWIFYVMIFYAWCIG